MCKKKKNLKINYASLIMQGNLSNSDMFFAVNIPLNNYS